MKITIENFGAIKHFVFDTEKDLTLIFGKNSVGKSYSVSLIYLILKNILVFSSSSALNEMELIKAAFEQEQKINDETILTKKFLGYFFVKNFVKPLNDSIRNTFADLKSITNQLSKEKLKITIENPHVIVILNLNDNLDEVVVKHLESYEGIFDFNNLYYFPASRSGLYQGLSSFGAIFAELSKNRNSISKSFDIPALSEPVSDYYLNLSNIETSNENYDLLNYIEEIEREILQGKVEFDNQTKKMYFTPNDTTLRLDVALATSSMVAEIAPIVSYLKYVCSTATKEGQKPLIFIEEPEAHLHPETQVKLMRVFARLVKNNKIKLVMTSHSNYIFNATSNLVMDNKIPADKFEAVLFKMTEEGSVAQNMATDEYGIDDDNFIDVAESLYEEKIEIINKRNG
jgi:predicted ATPase